MKKVTFEQVRDSFYEALVRLGVEEDKIIKFIEGETTIKDLELCLVTSLCVENQMLNEYPNWQGFVDSDTINTIYEYNKVALSEDVKDEQKE